MRARGWPSVSVLVPMIAAVLAFATFIGCVFVQHDAKIRAERTERQAMSASDIAWDLDGSPLPHPSAAPPRPLAEVRAAYAFAPRRADLLQFVPCHCGCERRGHRSNLDCYIRERVAGQAVWDDQAFT